MVLLSINLRKAFQNFISFRSKSKITIFFNQRRNVHNSLEESDKISFEKNLKVKEHIEREFNRKKKLFQSHEKNIKHLLNFEISLIKVNEYKRISNWRELTFWNLKQKPKMDLKI